MTREYGSQVVVIVILMAGCNCGGKSDTDEVDEPVEQPAQTEIVPASVPTSSVVGLGFGPIVLSNPEQDATGLSAALGVEQVGVVWIEQNYPGADVKIARMAGSELLATSTVSRGRSSFPPTAVAWTGKDYALAWGDDRYRHIEIFVSRVSASGKVVLKPRRLTMTTVADDAMGGGYSADSSQNPTLAYYDGQLIAAWGGPGAKGRQQVYQTTLTAGGKPRYTPDALTEGLTDAYSMRLVDHDAGALLCYCVGAPGGSDIFRLHLEGDPPDVGPPTSIATSDYVPCSAQHAVTSGGESVVYWAHRKQDKGGALEDVLMAQQIGAAGDKISEPYELADVRLIKFPGKNRAPFDVLGLTAELIAVAWVNREHDGGRKLKVGLFQRSGEPLGAPFDLPALADPTDPHLIEGDHPGAYVLLWLDRPEGGKNLQVMAAGLTFGT